MVKYRELEDLVRVDKVLVYEERQRTIFVLHRGKEIMIPKSQIAATSDVQGEGDSGILVIPRWLARDRGMLS